MPSTGLKVFWATASPPGVLITTERAALVVKLRQTASTSLPDHPPGVELMAAAPTG